MNDKFLGVQILPDQMQVVNPALVLFFIPFFDRVLYPYLSKMQFMENPLHRMAGGGLTAGMAFLCAGILELILQLNYPPLPGRHRAATNFINTLPCDIVIYSPFAPVLQLNSSGRFIFSDIVAHGSTLYNVTIKTESIFCGNIRLTKEVYPLKVLAVEYQVSKIDWCSSAFFAFLRGLTPNIYLQFAFAFKHNIEGLIIEISCRQTAY